MNRRNPFRDALFEPLNILAGGLTLSTAAALTSVEPLLIWVVAEAAYLLFVPTTSWYAQRLSRRATIHVEQSRDDIRDRVFPTLSPALRERYLRIESMRASITTRAPDEEWTTEILKKLDYLMDKFLEFAGKDQEYRAYLAQLLSEVSPGRREYISRMKVPGGNYSQQTPENASQVVDAIQNGFDEEIRNLQGKLDAEKSADSRAVLKKRPEVLQRRKEHVGVVGTMLTNLAYQLDLLQDTFGLISDELRARSPEQVTTDIDDVVAQANVMSKTMDEALPLTQST